MARTGTNGSTATEGRPPEVLPTARQPIIILGMHRSGTSLVSQLLDQFGLFVGGKLQDDHESTFFLDLNDLLLQRVNASWDHPLPFRTFLEIPAAVQMQAAALAQDLTGRRAAKFFYPRALLPGKSFESFETPWGWKDPRTLFTLPLWLRLFPGAKLVYIVRHGVDVASSLQSREHKLLKQRQERFADRIAQRSGRSALDRAGYKGSVRCLSLVGAFGLWTEYVEQAEMVLPTLPNPVHTVRYEDLLAQPTLHLRDLAAFCELPKVSDAAVQKAAATVNHSRANAFLADPQLAAFYDTVRTDRWMQKFGY